MGEQPVTWALHEQRLANLENKIDELLKRDNDFKVAVINGRTEYRKASELIGELYVSMKTLEGKRKQPGKIWQGIGTFLLPLLNLLTIIGILVALFHNK